MYNVNDIARFMVNITQKKGKPISNLKLQKLLYFAWQDYFRENKQELFGEEFCAWQFGPVVPCVYYDYCVFGAAPISLSVYGVFDENKLQPNDRAFIERLLKKHENTSVYDLVNMTHSPNLAWERTIRKKGNRSVIPFEEIKDDVLNGK